MGGDRETAIMFYSPLFCIPTRGESGAVFQPLKSLSEIMASGGAMNASTMVIKAVLTVFS